MKRRNSLTPILGGILIVLLIAVAGAAVAMGRSAGGASLPTEVPAINEAAAAEEQSPLPTQVITLATATIIPTVEIPPTVMPPPTEMSPTVSTYMVQPGEIAGRIALDLGVTLEDLKAANPNISNWDVIGIGQVLNVPTAPEEQPSVELAPLDGNKVRVIYGSGTVLEFNGYRPASLTAPTFSVDDAKAMLLADGEGSSSCEYQLDSDVWLFADTTAAHAGYENSGYFDWDVNGIRAALTSSGQDPANYYLVGDATSFRLTMKGGNVISSPAKGNTYIVSVSEIDTLSLSIGSWYAVPAHQLDGFLAIRWRHLACRDKARVPQFYPSVPLGSAWTGMTDVDAIRRWLNP